MLRTCVASLLMCVGVSASAQTWTAKKVVFQNPGPFTQQQLEDVSGMHVGSPLSSETLTAAAQKLSDSGYFLDIGAHLDGSAANVTAVFVLKPAPMEALLPVGFENFVWLSRDEVEKAIAAKFPLFIDRLQENSATADDIATVLQDALAAKGVSAKVEHETIEPTLLHPLRSTAFRVVKPLPVVANIKLRGVGPEMVPVVQKSVNQTAKTPYNAGLAGTLTSELILAPVLDEGYAQATLSGVTVAPGEIGTMTPVVVSATMSAGSVYRMAGLQFVATPVVSQEAFHTGVKLKAGDVASRKALLETLTPVDEAYRKLGYMDVIVKAEPTFDEGAKTVAYAVSVVPGEQYRIHEVTLNGLDPAAKAEVDKYFLGKPGALFNPVYIMGFISKNTALQTLAHYAGAYKAYADPNTHTVDLVINFYPSGARMQ